MNSAQQKAETIIALQNAAKIKEYLARGRQYEQLSNDELRNLNKTTFRAFAKVFTGGPELDAHSDCTSEHFIRGLEPDYSELTDELERMAEAVREVYESTSPEQHDEIESDLQREYDDHLRKRS